MKPIRLFFVTDLHGSELCFRKFISAVSIYNVDVAIALGDLAGKMVVPIFDNGNGSYDCNFLAQDIHLTNKTELDEQIKKINAIGFYPYLTDKKEADRLRSNQDEVMTIFHRLITRDCSTGWSNKDVEADEAKRIGASQLNSSVRRTVTGSRRRA